MASLYQMMFEDEVRMRAFEQAIAAMVRPGSVVVDIGSAMGTFSLLAAQRGARKVFGIEVERIVDVAREAAVRAGLADRVQFFEAYSSDVVLPEPADLLIFEDFTSFFLHGSLNRIYADARARLLKPGATFLPQAADLYMAPFDDADLYASIDPWGAEVEHLYGFDFTPMREMAVNSATYHVLSPSELLGEPVHFRYFDLSAEAAFDCRAAHEFTVLRDGTLHGVAVWFELQLAPDVRMSNAPHAPTIWGQGILPAEYPIPVNAGDAVRIELETVTSGTYGFFWNWNLHIAAGTGRPRPVVFRQTTFRSSPLPAALAGSLTVEQARS